MSFTRYGKKVLDLDDLTADQLFEKLTEYLMHSGFMDGEGGEFNLDELRRAIERALLSQPIIPLEELERLMDMQADERSEALAETIEKLLSQLIEEGYLGVPEVGSAQGASALPGSARFEVTQKGLDFLGYKTLQETLSKAGRASFGRHDTNRLSTGVEAYEAPKPYEFGDTLNLDPTATVLEAVKRQRSTGGPIQIEPQDLRVRQSELTVAAATVVMLDCSHSMILYGEDRFSPAKRVALALSHLIRTQFPGDELSLVMFHDSAEEVPFQKLPQVQVGPYHTNTAEGLKLARAILARTRRDLKQIVMITDGKPSAITLPDGRIYKQSFGLDPLILKKTFEQVAACRRSNIQINTFMLARDPTLIAFVKKMSEIARGKAYFTTPETLGEYVTMDFMTNKIDTVH